MSDEKPRKFITYPAVIDWLQWYKFDEPIGKPDYPQLTLSLLSELRQEISQLEERCKELEQKLETAIHALEFYAQSDFAPDNDVAVAALRKLK